MTDFLTKKIAASLNIEIIEVHNLYWTNTNVIPDVTLKTLESVYDTYSGVEKPIFWKRISYIRISLNTSNYVICINSTRVSCGVIFVQLLCQA